MSVSSVQEKHCFGANPVAYPSSFDPLASSQMSGFFSGNRRDVKFSDFEFSWYKPVAAQSLNDMAYGICRHIAKDRVFRFSAAHMLRVDASAWQDIAQDMYNMAKG